MAIHLNLKKSQVTPVPQAETKIVQAMLENAYRAGIEAGRQMEKDTNRIFTFDWLLPKYRDRKA